MASGKGDSGVNGGEAEGEDLCLDLDDDDDDSGSEKSAPAWLSSYSDMMTDLMAIFVVLFAFTMMATSQQNQQMKQQLEDSQNSVSASLGEEGGKIPETESKLDEVFEQIRQKIERDGYSDSIQLEKTDGYITFRFKDNVLFYPDSPIMLGSSFNILKYIGDMILSVDSEVDAIEISGFTAEVSTESETNFFAWELSSDRAISVLKFFSMNCSLPQAKMSISGYSHYRPVANNDSEEGRSLNRRVEVKIVRADS